MTFVSSSDGFPGLSSKSSPVGSDIIIIADSAANNAIKQCTLTQALSAGSSGGLVLITSGSASNQSTLDFVNVVSASYDNYLIVISGFIPVTGTGVTLHLIVGTGPTPTWFTTGGGYQSSIACFANNTTASVAASSAFAPLMASQTQSSTSAGGNINIYDVNSSANDKLVNLSLSYLNGGAYAAANGMVWVGTTTALTSFRFQYSSGNISAGNASVYGYSK